MEHIGDFSILSAKDSHYNVVRTSDIKVDKKGKISNINSIIIAEFENLEVAQAYCRAYITVWKDTDFTWLFQRNRIPSEIFFTDEKDLNNISKLLKEGKLFSRDLQLLIYVYIANIYNKLKRNAVKRAEVYGDSVKKLPIKVVQELKKDVIVRTPYFIQAYNLLLNLNLMTKATDVYRLNFDMLRVQKKRYMTITEEEKERCKEVMELLRNVGMCNFTMTRLKYLVAKGD